MDGPVSSNHDWSFCLSEVFLDLSQRIGIRRSKRNSVPRSQRTHLEFFSSDVFGEFQMGRTEFLVLGDLERLPDGFVDDIRAIELCVPLGHRFERPEHVDSLVALLVEPFEPALPSYRDQRTFV